jgi:hypothetical protein
MNDQYEGMGGSYRIDSDTGARVLVSRTEDAPPPAPPDPDPAPAAPSKPAKAGFFTPVDPVPPADTTNETE